MIKTRSSQHELLYYDPEIERTLRRIRKEQRKIQVDLECNLEKLFEEESNMAERTLKELGAPKLDDEPLCISKARVCGICSELSHTTDACPTLQTEDVNALGGFPGQPPTYNEGWRDHPNLRYGPKPPFPQTTNPRPWKVHNQGVQYQQKTDTHLQNIDTQIGQICTSLSNLERQLSGKLPSQPHPNPKEQVNRVILREPEEANELDELEVISEESINTIKLLDAINVKIVGVLNNALIRVINIFFLDDFYVIDTKHESAILLGRPFLKTSKALIDVAKGSVVLKSNGEKIELNMIDKVRIPEANATDYVANFLEQIGVDNLETILDEMVAD
ncbi:DNA damage-inducible protein 1, partial [Bienertia sinuspersici]